MIRQLAAGMLLALAGACAKPSARTAMRTHYDRALDAHAAILIGQVEVARTAGAMLDAYPDQDLPPGSQLLEEDLRQYARQLAAAENLLEAAIGTAGIATTCGQCHSQFGGGPRFTGGELRTDRLENVGTEMQRHTWAVSRLWEGLIGPSDEAWMAGATVLRDAPLQPSSFPTREGVNQQVADLEQRVHDLGRLSVTASGEERTVIYSNLIVTCASCHELVRQTR